MDKKLACHDIALAASKMYADANRPEYKKEGYEQFVKDLTTRYMEAYSHAEKELKEHRS